MATYNNPMPNGSVDVQRYFPEVRRVHIASTSLSFATQTAAYNLNNWLVAVQQNEYLYATAGVTTFELTTDDPNIVTTAKGKKYLTNKPAPSATCYLDMNWEDYQELQNTLKGGQYGIIYELEDGTLLMLYEDHTFKPIPAVLDAVGRGLSMPGDANDFRVYISHNDYNDFLKVQSLDPDWDTDELVNAMPAGLKMFITGDCSVASGCTVTVYIETRNGDPYTGLDEGDFEVVEDNYLDSADVSAASDDGGGAYTLTLQKGTSPGDLAAGDYCTLRVKKLSTLDVTHASNLVTVVAVA